MKLLVQFFRSLQKYARQGHLLIRPVLRWVSQRTQKIDHYFSRRPTARRRVLIASVIFGPPYQLLLILTVIIWLGAPSKRTLRNIQNQVASEVYSADSVLLGRYYLQNRTEVKYEDIAPHVITALVATEDARFYEHAGIDFISLGRVLVKSIFLQDESAGGGSTITQQLSKNLYPRKRYWFFSILINKIREVITAQRLEKVYSKQELLTLYLNTVPFADNTFGIEAAAQRFYSTSARDITIDQAAVLIGTLKATHSYNPRLFPERAEDRRNIVLAQMVKYHVLADSVADSLKQLSLNLSYNKTTHHQGLAPYFREYLKGELTEWCKRNKKNDGTPYNLYTDGLVIYTTIDSKLQAYAEHAVVQQMTEIQKIFFDHWGKEKPWKGKGEVLDNAIKRSSRYQQLKAKGLDEEEIMTELQRPVPMKLFSWDGVRDAVLSPVDSIIHHMQYLNAGFLAMEPQTGNIKAWVGGIDHDFFQYDHVKESTKRQVGSVFKPIVYAMALEKGAEPCALIAAERETYIDKEGKEWAPRNMQNDYGVRYSMRGALAYSINTVAVKLIQEAGVSNTIALARKMGITSDVPDVPSIALGSSSISLLEMTTAYACLANMGKPVIPDYISSITDLDGNVYRNFAPEPKTTSTLSDETSRLMIHMLRTVVHEGTASRIRWRYGVYNDMAGKTGTTQANADGWFMSMTPNLAMGAWVGADDPRIRFRTTYLGQGSNTALPITAYFMKQVNKDTTYRKITEAKFEPLPRSLRQAMDCDLYELNPELEEKIMQLIHVRDSIIHADTLAEPPRETFLEMLYRRKQKILQASDTTATQKLEVVGG